MKRTSTRFATGLVLCVMFSILHTGMASATPLDAQAAQSLDNLHQVSDTLWRSAMPADAGFAALDDSAFNTVVSLRWKPDPLDATPSKGPKRVHIPLRTWRVKESDILAFLKIATNPQHQPVLVHCKHGADRTGTMVAAYRIVVQGWSKDKALEEMTSERYGYHSMWRNLPKLIRKLDVNAMRRELGLPKAASP